MEEKSGRKKEGRNLGGAEGFFQVTWEDRKEERRMRKKGGKWGGNEGRSLRGTECLSGDMERYRKEDRRMRSRTV